MFANMMLTSRMLAMPADALSRIRAAFDSVLARAQMMPDQGQPMPPQQPGQPMGQPPAPKPGGFPTWAIILIVVVALLIVVPVGICCLLTLLGPVIGNTFSTINSGI